MRDGCYEGNGRQPATDSGIAPISMESDKISTLRPKAFNSFFPVFSDTPPQQNSHPPNYEGTSFYPHRHVPTHINNYSVIIAGTNCVDQDWSYCLNHSFNGMVKP